MNQLNQNSVDQLRIWTSVVDIYTVEEKAAAFDRLKPMVPTLLAQLDARAVEAGSLSKRIEALDFDNKNLVALAGRRLAESEALMAELRKQAEAHREEIRKLDRASVDRVAEVKKLRLDIETLTAENARLVVIASTVSRLEVELVRKENELRKITKVQRPGEGSI